MKRILLISIIISLSCSKTITHSSYSGEGLLDGNAEKLKGAIDKPIVPWSPWWLGPNVCTERREEIGDWKFPSQSSKEEEMFMYGWTIPSHSPKKQQTLGLCKLMGRNDVSFISYNCTEEADKHICTLIKDYKGHNKTEIITQKCCHGYSRPTTSGKPNMVAPCKKILLPPMIDFISEQLNGSYFIRIAQKNNISNELKSNVTLFMPSDAKFFDSVMRIKLKEDKSGITSKSMIMNHIVHGIISMEDVKNDLLVSTEYNNNTIRINTFPRRKVPELGSSSSLNDERPNLYTANCEPIIKVDQNAEEGIVHVVDRILSPVTKSLMELVREREDMTILQTILDRTDFAEQLENANKTFTLFAPTDEAFEEFFNRTEVIRPIIEKGNGCALNILKNHLLDMTYCSAAVFEGDENSVIDTIGGKFTIKRYHSVSQRLNRAKQLTDADNLIVKESITINGQSEIIESDIMATNGVMHVIDTVLSTDDSSFSITSYLESHNSLLFKTLLELNGINDLVDSYDNVVVFAPTDSSLQSNKWVKKIKSDPKSLKGDTELTKYLKYHFAKPSNKSCESSSFQHSSESKTGDLLHVNFYPSFRNFKGTTVNCARLVHPNDDSCGSIMYQIDQPIQIPSQTIFELLKANEQYSMFLELLEIANLTSLLKHKDLRLTVLVPKNEIFTEIKKYFNELTAKGNGKQVENILKMYIIYGEFCCAAFIEPDWISKKHIQTIANKQLGVRYHKRPWIENAGIIKCDIMATNGIIHEISDVLSFEKKNSTLIQTRVNNS